jgi:hypothetical protein
MVHEAVKFIVFDYYSDRKKTADNHKHYRNFAKTAIIIRIFFLSKPDHSTTLYIGLPVSQAFLPGPPNNHCHSGAITFMPFRGRSFQCEYEAAAFMS